MTYSILADPLADTPPPQFNHLASGQERLNLLPSVTPDDNLSRLSLYQSDVSTPYVHSFFLGVQHRMNNDLTLEVSTLGSVSRKLITTDIVNRNFSLPPTLENLLGLYNPDLPRLYYRANQGTSDYNALAAVARYRTRHGQFQIAYTWSHTIDNQSEPLAGDFLDLRFTRVGSQEPEPAAAFSRQFDPRVDRGNSDFDQRHNLVFYSIWEPAPLLTSSKAGVLFRNWRVSQLGALRSGRPFTVGAAPLGVPLEGEPIVNNRADVLNPSLVEADQRSVEGGRLLLNRDAFATPLIGRLGNSARNAFNGPGFFSLDLSLSRSFSVRSLGEAGRLTFRVDAFNVLNHANLGDPEPFLSSSTFGQASYGRKGRSTGFPTQEPFTETAREIQLLFRIEF